MGDRPKHPAQLAHITKRHAETARASIRVTKLVQRLEQASEGTRDMTVTQLTASKILLDKVLPSLQAVDQTITANEHEQLSEHELLDKLRVLIAAHPELARSLLTADAEQGKATGQKGQPSH